MLFLTLPAAAQARDVEVGTVVICDTQQQAERVGALMHGDAKVALTAINAEAYASACGLANVAYLRGPTLATVRTRDEAFEIARIMVVGVATETGVQAMTPAFYFIVVKIDERVA
jgi:citrate lyase beta subunit